MSFVGIQGKDDGRLVYYQLPVRRRSGLQKRGHGQIKLAGLIVVRADGASSPARIASKRPEPPDSISSSVPNTRAAFVVQLREAAGSAIRTGIFPSTATSFANSLLPPKRATLAAPVRP